MIDYMSIGPAPSEEECAQVGSPDYSNRALIECRRFKQLLIKRFGEPPGDAQVVIKNEHGEYYDVQVKYNTDNKEEVDYALKLERETPAKWFNTVEEKIERLKELGKEGYLFIIANQLDSIIRYYRNGTFHSETQKILESILGCKEHLIINCEECK